jgi:hypothetical protein
MQFSFKDRIFKAEQNVEHIVFHISHDGNLLQHESDDHRDQQFYWETKQKNQKQMLSEMNKEIANMDGGDPRKSAINNLNFKFSRRKRIGSQEVIEKSVQLPREVFPDLQLANPS